MPTSKARSYAAQAATAPLAPFAIERREPGPTDVEIDILFCGVCHSDLHQARDEWHNTSTPASRATRSSGASRASASGHAIQGRRQAGVGCMVDSCRTCANCKAGKSSTASRIPTFTYNGDDKVLGGKTYGGYSTGIVVDEAFVLRIPAGLDPAAAAPLLCAGITTYSPLRHWKVEPGQKVGVVGLGGLGHMGVKFAHALGAQVVLFTTSPGKIEDGKRLGADQVVVSRNPAEMDAHAGSFELVLDCVSAQHDIERVPEAAQARRDARPGRCPRAPAAGVRLQPAAAAPAVRRLRHRGHQRRPRRCSTSARSTASPPTSR